MDYPLAALKTHPDTRANKTYKIYYYGKPKSKQYKFLYIGYHRFGLSPAMQALSIQDDVELGKLGQQVIDKMFGFTSRPIRHLLLLHYYATMNHSCLH